MIRHPGRPADPDETVETRHSLNPETLPKHHAQVASLGWQEPSRQRVVSELRRFARWVATRKPRLTPAANPRDVLPEYVHTLVRALSVHPEPRRRVTRPTTPQTWIKLLSMGLPALRGAEHWRESRSLMLGYQALAPAPSTSVQRDVQGQWLAARDAVQRQFAHCPTRLLAALWLALELGRQGLRPKAAARGAMAMSKRSLFEVPRPHSVVVWRVEVRIDKDNKVGQIGAPRVRWIPRSKTVDLIMQHLPYGNYQLLTAARKATLKAFGIRQTYAARRDAAAAAEASGRDVTALLNHRPGSRHTPGYAGTTTPTSLLLALLAHQ